MCTVRVYCALLVFLCTSLNRAPCLVLFVTGMAGRNGFGGRGGGWRGAPGGGRWHDGGRRADGSAPSGPWNNDGRRPAPGPDGPPGQPRPPAQPWSGGGGSNGRWFKRQHPAAPATGQWRSASTDQRSYADVAAQQQTGPPPISNEPTLGNMFTMLKDVLTRVMFLENRGPDCASGTQGRPAADQTETRPAPGGDKRGKPPVQGPAVQTGPRNSDTSDNNDFACVWKCLYRQVQLQHHAGNWKQLPESLTKRLNKFANDINPPMPDSGLRAKVNAATEAFGQRICSIVGEHLDAKLSVNEVEASTLDNNRDVDKAKTVADKHLTCRLGRRINDVHKKSLLDDAVRKIGTSRQPPAAAATPDADGFVAVAPGKVRSDGLLSAVRTPGKRRHLSSPSSVACRNRFAALATEMDDEPGPVEQSPVVQTPVKKSRTDGRRTPKGVVKHHDSTAKASWTLEPCEGTKVLVIGDSNLRKADATGDATAGWEIHSFSGAKFKHVSLLVEQMRCPTSLEHVIVQVGVNHRDDALDATTQDLYRLEKALETLGCNFSFAGVSVPATLELSAKCTVRRINQNLNLGALKFIPALREDEVGISPGDGFGIHHDDATVGKVIASMVAHVQRLN